MNINEKQLKELVRQGGAIYRGLQFRSVASQQPLVLFDDPRSHTTLALPLSDCTVDNVRKKVLDEDRKMMENPERWPVWPWLPLKRANRNPFVGPDREAIGCLFADGKGGEAASFYPGQTFFDEKFHRAREAGTVEVVKLTPVQLVADGWMVD